MQVDRRQFWITTGKALGGMTLVRASAYLSRCGSSSGGSPTGPTSPSTPVPSPSPTVPQYELRNPKTIAFAFDKSRSERIGEVRFAGRAGTLKEVMEAARLDHQMRDTDRGGLLTSFESVRPSSNRGVILLINGVRFTSEVSSKNSWLEASTPWAAYEWMGPNTATETNRVYVFIGE